MVYRIVGRINGEGQGYVLGFTKDKCKGNYIRSTKNIKGWKFREIQIIECVNKK